LLSRVAVDPDSHGRYPDGTVLIPSDAPDTSSLIAAAIAERRPMAVVFPDGSDVIARPPDVRGLALVVLLAAVFLIDRVNRNRDRPTFVPREWVTEFHAAPDRELVAS
jgi:hypothetical protein